MKLKYYLRGMGIGIIVTTIILAISFSQREVEISDEQVMVRASALGMVMPEDEQEPAATESEEEPQGGAAGAEEEPQSGAAGAEEESQGGATESEEEQEQSTQDSAQMPQNTGEEAPTQGTYRLVIRQGDVCRVVCETLEENGIIDDAEALRTHLFELGYANNISTGEYDVPYGLTMEQVAEIIVAGPLE